MLNTSFENIIHFQSDAPRGIKAIYVNTALRNIGLSLVGIFMPVYIFLESQKVFGGSASVGFYGVAAYFFLMQLVKLTITIPTAKTLSKFGFRRAFTVGNGFLIFLLILFVFSDEYFSLLFLAAIVHAFSVSFYRISYHTLFAGDGLKGKLGGEMSLQRMIERFSNIIGPLVGGLIITLYGFQILFLISLFIVAISITPFFFMNKHEHKEKISTRSVKSWFENKEHKNEIVSGIGRHIEDTVAALFLPIYSFSIVGSFARQGFVESITLILGTISVYIAGKLFDKRRSRGVFKFGAVSTTLLTLAMGFVSTTKQLVLIGGLHKILNPLYWMNYDALWYRKSQNTDEGSLMFAVVDSILASFGVFVVLTIAVIFAESSFRFWAMWILAAIGINMAFKLWTKGKKYE